MPSDRPHAIVIGIGHPDRGDDAAGRVVARRLQGVLSPEVAIIEHDGEATSLLALFEGAGMAFLIDACASAAPVGTIRRFDAHARSLPEAAFNTSTHGMGLPEAIELARALGQLPARCIVYAIEAGCFDLGAPLSPRVAVAIGEVCDRLRREVEGAFGSGDSAHA